jgi:hypothetical protein
MNIVYLFSADEPIAKPIQVEDKAFLSLLLKMDF